MIRARALLTLSRLLLAVLCGSSSLYCIMAYLPFAYQQVINGDLIPAITFLARIHPILYLAANMLVGGGLFSDWRSGGRPWTSLSFPIFQCAASIALLIHPVLSHLHNNHTSYYWSMAALLPLFWLATLDWQGRIDWDGLSKNASHGHTARIFFASLCSGLTVTLLYFLLAWPRFAASQNPSEGPGGAVWVCIYSLVFHLFVFTGLALLLHWACGLARLLPRSGFVELLFVSLLSLTLGWMAVTRIVWESLTFLGWPAGIYTAVFLLSLLSTYSGLRVRLAQMGGDGVGELATGLDLLVGRSSRKKFEEIPGKQRLLRIAKGAAVFGVLAVVGSGMAVKTMALDWNYLLQKITAVSLWLSFFICFYAILPELRRGVWLGHSILACATLPLAAYGGLAGNRWLVAIGSAGASVKGANGSARASTSLLDRYANYDVSFRLVREMLTPPPPPSAESFYQFLGVNTNLSVSVDVHPVEVNLVDPLERAAGEKPDIYIFVIDSLRRDYLSPYNPAVHFTPAVDGFARESIVMEQAFTRYGGTGLSEPSLWTGGMLLHKQYVTPYAPMNTLQKLLETDHYRAFITRDSVLATVVSPAPWITELDKDRPAMAYELGRTLAELRAKMDTSASESEPLFVYTQPQDIHISVIRRENESVLDQEDYKGFYAPYASRVHRIDRNLGVFFQFLKDRGKYDNSIIVLTADHGDSLGEDGRWGHAYTIFPEILRIPLIIHLPAELRARLAFDAQSVAFLTDVTPSVYYLLGHRPIVNSELTGRPLFTESFTEQSLYRRDAYLEVASYGPVYGILSEAGRKLYISDGVNYQDYFFDLSTGGAGTRQEVTASRKQQSEAWIRRQIEMIDSFYGFHPATR